MSEQQLKELRERNEFRAKKAKEQLGNKWCMHPDHKPSRKQK